MNRSLVMVILGIMMSCGDAHGRLPNVVLFFADDMGIGDVGAYGCEDIKTPNLDALASAGVRFTNYYSARPDLLTVPGGAVDRALSSSLRASPPTSARFPTASGCLLNRSPSPELAKTRGYATAVVGKWHLGFTYDTQPNAQGFDFFFGPPRRVHRLLFAYLLLGRQSPSPSRPLPQSRGDPRRRSVHDAPDHTRGHVVHRRSQGRAVPALAPPTTPRTTRLRPLSATSTCTGICRRSVSSTLHSWHRWTSRSARSWTRLRHHNLTENTIVFFMSDNGASVEIRNNGGGGSNGPFRGNKGSLFEGGIRMPAIVQLAPAQSPKAQLAISSRSPLTRSPP